MTVSIYSFAVNDKFPLDIMHRYFKKYMKEDFIFTIFNDADNPQMENNINTICSFNNINCVRVPQHIHKIHNPSECYASTLNWAVHKYAVQYNRNDIVVLIHSDIFPICDTSMSDLIGNNIVASTAEFRLMDGKGISYLYPAFTIVNMNLLSNPQELDFGLAPGLDVGGKTQDFITKYTNLVKFLPNHQISYFMRTLNENESLAQYFKKDLEISQAHGLSSGWVSEGGMYHYMAGSQWNAGDKSTFAAGHQKRMDLFLHYFY